MLYTVVINIPHVTSVAFEGSAGFVWLNYSATPPDPNASVQVSWEVIPGTASTDDYTVVQPQVATFTPRVWSDGISPIPVVLFNKDNLVEEQDETFTLRLSVTGATFAGGGSTRDVEMEIVDDPPIVTIQAGDTQAAETRPGETADLATFRVLRTGGDLTTPLAVTLGYTGDATKDADYTAPTTVNVLSETLVTVTPIDDLLDETVNTDPGESIIADVLADPMRYHPGDNTTTVNWVRDNDWVLFPIDVTVTRGGKWEGAFVKVMDRGQPAVDKFVDLILVKGPAPNPREPAVSGDMWVTDFEGEIYVAVEADVDATPGLYEYVLRLRDDPTQATRVYIVVE